MGRTLFGLALLAGAALTYHLIPAGQPSLADSAPASQPIVLKRVGDDTACELPRALANGATTILPAACGAVSETLAGGYRLASGDGTVTLQSERGDAAIIFVAAEGGAYESSEPLYPVLVLSGLD